MLRNATVVVIAAAGLLGLARGAAAQERERGRRARAEAVDTVAGRFSAAERRIMIDYFSEHRLDVRPLPPGIARNLARGKPLPPGIAKRGLPTELTAQLPKRPDAGVEITIFGDRIVLLEASGLVVDILEEVFRQRS